MGRPKVKKVSVTCIHCGKVIEKYPSEIKRRTYFTCGRECFAAYEKATNGKQANSK